MFTKITALASLLALAQAYDNGLAKAPQMGWNTWNTFACDINETTIMSAAKEIKRLNLDKYGYKYIVMDDCWSLHQRNASGYLQYDPEKFPRGIEAIADDIHEMGLLWGMYSSAGTMTCGRYPGSLGFEEKDAQLFASWKVDYLKYDNCFNEGQSGTPKISYDRYKAMSDALNKTGRPILYSMCNWGEDGTWNWAPTIANSWRMSGDIGVSFDRYDDRCPCTGYDCTLPGYHCSIMNILNKFAPIGQKSHEYAWNDLDMLEVGRGGLTYEEQKLHFTMWGHDVTKTSKETLSIITNWNIINLSQGHDWSVAIRSYNREDIGSQLWYQTNKHNNSVVVAILNTKPYEQDLTASFNDIFLDDHEEQVKHFAYELTDLWSGLHIEEVKRSFTARVKAHGVVIVRMDPIGAPLLKIKNAY